MINYIKQKLLKAFKDHQEEDSKVDVFKEAFKWI